MKRMILAAALACIFAVPAQAEILFRGIFEYTAVANCPAGRPSVGYRANFQFHPRNLGGNANFAAIILTYDHGGQEYTLSDGLDFSSSFQVVRNGGLGWTVYTPSEVSRVRFTQTIPAQINLLPTTPSLTIVGKIRNPFGDTGAGNCIADFRAVLLRYLG